MMQTQRYASPLGEILLAADEEGLAGLWFEGQKHFAHALDAHRVDGDCAEGDNDALHSAVRWLDAYFNGGRPDFTPPLHLVGTPFQLEVWQLLLKIPYGQTTTYGELARRMAQARGRACMSAQAVGGAVGRNNISIIVPCHRVVGSNGSLTGYAGGIQKKVALLTLEGADMARLTIPTKGTAL